MKIKANCTVEFLVTEGDPSALTEDQQFELCGLLMAELPQGQVILQGADPLMDEPVLVMEPIGWKVDTKEFADLIVGSLCKPQRSSGRTSEGAE